MFLIEVTRALPCSREIKGIPVPFRKKINRFSGDAFPQ